MSRMETYTTSISLGEESAQMWNLNKRLEAYLSRVKALEEENELLRAEIHHLKSTRSDKSVIRKYHDEIMKLRDALDEEHREMVQAETDRDCIYQEIEYVKELCLQEKQAQEDVKKELSESKKLLEEEKRAQAWLKERLIHLEEEMEDILKTHEEDKALMEEEISSYSQKLENFKLAPVNFKPVNVEDYASKMSQIWQGAVEEYKIEVSALETNLSQAKENLKKVLDENKQSQLQLQTLDRDLQSLKGRKEMLEELLAKQWLDQQDEENRLQLEIETLEKEKEDLRVQIAQVLEDRQQLMHLKMSLSLEVATYRSLLEAESTRLYTPSADYKISSSFSDSMLDQSTLKKSRRENTKSLVSRDNRLSAKKNQSVETSSTSRYLNMKSTSLSNRASPVTKEFQKVSSVLQSQSLNYTKASPAKATPTLPPVESNLGKHPQKGEVFKKSNVETISQSYSRESFKPIAKETVRKESVIQSVVNGSAYDTTDAGLQKTNRTGDAKAELPLSTEKEVVSAKLETSSKTDLVSEEQQKFVETQNKDNDTFVFEKPHQEKVDIEVPLAIDDHAGENFGSVDEEHIIEKQEVISQIVSCQRVYVQKEALMEPLDYEHTETPVRENYEEFRKVLDFSKPNKQDLGEPNVLSSGDVSVQEIEHSLSQELDFDVDKASQDVNQGVDEERQEIPQDTNILEYNDKKLDQQSSIQDDDFLEADQYSDEKQEVTQCDHEQQEGIELAGINKEEFKTESEKEEEEKDYTHEQVLHESTDIEQPRILNVEEVYQSSHHVLEEHKDIELQSQEEKNNIEESDPQQDSQIFKDQQNTDIVKAPEEIAQQLSSSHQEESVDQKNEDNIDQMDNGQKEASQLSEDMLGSPQAGLEDLKRLDLSNAEEESQEVGGDNIENKQVAQTLERERGNQLLDSHPDLNQEELHESVEVISNEEVEDIQKVVQSDVETQSLQTKLEQQAREDVTEEEERDIKTIMAEAKDGEEDKKDVIEEEYKSYEEDNVVGKEETTSAGEEDSCISEYKEEDTEDLKEEENYEAFLAAEYTKAVKTEVIAQYVQKEYVSYEEDNITEKEESTPADDEEDSCVPEDKENTSEESYEVCTVVEYTKSMKAQVIAQTIHEEYVSYEEDSVTEKEEPTLASEEENSCTLEHETEEEQEQVKEQVFSAEDEYKEKVEDKELVQKESDIEFTIAKEDVSLLQQETEPIVEGQSEVSTDMEQENAKLGDVHQDSEVGEDLPTDRETHLQHESEDLVQSDVENHHEESSEVVQTTEEYSLLKEDETKQFVQKDDIMEDAQTNATLESQEKEINVKQDEEGGNEVEEKSSFQQEPEEGQKGYDEEAKEEKDGDHQEVEEKTKGHQEEEERQEADQQEVEKPQECYQQEVDVGQEGHHHEAEEGQQSYQQEVGKEQEGSHQEVERHESHDQEVEDHVVSEENESILKDSAEEQYMGFSLNIIPNNLRFSSENDEKTQLDHQEQRSNTPEEGTETHQDNIQAHEGEFKSFEQTKNIILEEKEKEQEIFEKEIICQQSTFSLAHEYENLHSENIKSHVVFAENTTEKYEFETPTEKHTTELDETQAASIPDNEHSKSEDSLDSQDISIYSPRSEEFEISKDYQCEQTLPDTTPLPNLDDEFEDLAEDEIILASEHSAELKSQSPPDSGEVEEVLDSSLESQSSQIHAEVSEQSNLRKDDGKDLDYTEQQAEGSKDLIEKELPTQFVDSKKTEDSSETLDTEEPSAEPNTQTEDNKIDDESSEYKEFTISEDDVILPTKVDELETTKDSQLENTKDQEQLFSEQLPTQLPNLDDEFENLAEDEIISTSEVTELQSPADDGKFEEVLDSSLESQSSQVLADDDKDSDYKEQQTESHRDVLESERPEHIVDSKAEDSSPILDPQELAEEPNTQIEDLIDNKVVDKTFEFKDSTISQEEVVTFLPKVDEFEDTKDSQLEEIQYETSLPDLTPEPENLTDEQLSSEQLSSDSVDKGYTDEPEEGWTANTENVLMESTEFVPSSGLSETELAPASSHEDTTINEENITEEHSDFRLVETERVDTEDHKRETCEEDITSLPNLGGEFENLAADVTKLQSPEDGDEPEEILDSSLESQSSQILPEVSEESSFIKGDDRHHTEQQAESPEDLFESEQPKQFVDHTVEDSYAIPDTEEPAIEPSEDPVDIKFDDENSESEESITSQEEVAISPKVKEFEPTKDSQLEETQCETSPSDDQVELSGEQLVSETVDKDQNEEDEEMRISLDEDVKILTKELDVVPSSDHSETELVPAPSQEDTTENEECITKEHSDLLTQEFNLQQTETVDAEDHDVDFLKKEDKEIALDIPLDGTKEPSTESVDEFNGDNVISSNVPNVLSEESEVQDKIIQAENQEDVNLDVKPSEESSENDDSVTSDESSPNVSTISYTPKQEDGKTQCSEKDDISGDIDSKTPKELEQSDPEQVPEASLVEKLDPQTPSSEEEKDILGEKNDSSFDSHEEHEEDMSEVIREYNEEGKTVNGIFGHTIVQATLDFEDHMLNGHSTGENREIVISEAKTIVRLDEDIVYSQSEDKVEDSVIEFTISEGKSEGLFQSLLETSEHKEGRLDEASEIKNFMQAAVKYVDSAAEQSHYTKEIVNPYLSEKDLDVPSEISSSVVDEDFMNTNKEIGKTSQGLKTTQEREDSWSSDE
ncbi:nestin [Leptodactylus fuscus]|uniref:nestin n=1 Tax=Leptodactylus fuscus TaxID=238119 RepID=UPI003F4F1FD1